MQCHLCAEKEGNPLARCCIKKCNKSYCLSCIRNQFNSEFGMEMYRKQTWICYGCQSLCNCKKCAKGENNDKKGKRGPKPKNVYDDPNVLNSSSTAQTNKKLQQINQLTPQSPNFPEQIIEQSEQPQFRLYLQQYLSSYPPFYLKIVERREQFYNHCIREGKNKLIKKKIHPNKEEQQKDN